MLVPVLVPDMVVLSLIQLLTFRRASGVFSVIICTWFLINFHFLYVRQINMDYSICQAVSYNSSGLTEALIEYDVACQWSIHFDERLQGSSTLTWPPNMSRIDGIGKFHIGGHQPSCFPKYSLNFIQGAGQQDGEILETLWAALNKTAGSTRAMSKFHRQEMLDDHMLDSNWKKLVNMGKIRYSWTVVL